MKKLDRDFYLSEDVVKLSRFLLGKVLCHDSPEGFQSGVIIETEAYAGISDKASHAYGDRRTARTEVMYQQGGTAYIYLCYGIHSLFNVVTAPEGIPHAVLLRGLDIQEGRNIAALRFGKPEYHISHSNGPGKLSKAMGLHFKQSGEDLVNGSIWIEDRGIIVPSEQVKTGPRIGIDYAEEDALLPYRFLWDQRFRSG